MFETQVWDQDYRYYNRLCEEHPLAIESGLDFVGAVMIFFAGAIPAYLSFKLRGDMAKLTIALTVFIVIHGIYHVAKMLGMESMADGVLEPVSVVALIAFGAVFIGVSKKKEVMAGK